MGSDAGDDAQRPKVCCTCKQDKPLTEFNRLKKSPDGRQPSCRECNKAYHYANWDRHMDQIRARSRRMRKEAQLELMLYLIEHPCVDCGETDPVVLEFDHLRDKEANVGTLVTGGYGWERARVEIEKCEVVCANCHRRRTFARNDCYRIPLAAELLGLDEE